jgi:hypothetical protein
MGREAEMGDQGARAGVAERPRKGARPMGREGVWSGLFLYLFIHFSFLVFSLFCFYFLRFNFKLEHKLTNEKNSQQANSSIKRNMYSSVMQQSKLP